MRTAEERGGRQEKGRRVGVSGTEWLAALPSFPQQHSCWLSWAQLWYSSYAVLLGQQPGLNITFRGRWRGGERGRCTAAL